MLFAGEPRFKKDLRPLAGGDVFVYAEQQTLDHLGPGAYHSTRFEDVRSGWVSKSFSKRQPLAPHSQRHDRSHHFVSGELLSTGIAIPSSPLSRMTPGPGHYLGPLVTSPPKFSFTRPSSAMGSSHRIARDNSVLKDGVLFQCLDSGIDLGPGYYNPPAPALEKKSYNIRAIRASHDRSVLTGSRLLLATAPAKSFGHHPRPTGSNNNGRNQQQNGRQSESYGKRAASAPRLGSRRIGMDSPGVGGIGDFDYSTPVQRR